MRYILINKTSKLIENAIEIDPDIQSDPEKAWKVPEGFFILPSDSLNIGGLYEEK